MRVDVWKPWYVYRPHQLLRRVAGMLVRPESEYTPVRAAWGLDLLANPVEHLGRSLYTTGIYDLAVSEVIFRLVCSGDFFVDAGANIGYMTLLGAVAAGPNGRAMAFEPHPKLFPVLKKNVERASRAILMAPVELRPTALGAERRTATLVLPNGDAENDGLAFIPRADRPSQLEDPSVSISMETLDEIIHEQTVGVLKIDVEGYECPLLQGAIHAVHAHRIRHVVFEDHQGADSAAALLLKKAGYTLFSIGWSMPGPLLAESRPGQSLAARYEAPSYLATAEPDEAIRVCGLRGWRVLRRQTRKLTMLSASRDLA